MMNFFEDEPRPRPVFPLPDKELFAYSGRPWLAAPDEYIVPAVLPWSLPLGRSERTIVALRNIEVWPEAITLRISVYALDNLIEEGRIGLVDHSRVPDRDALLIGVLFADGKRASSDTISMPSPTRPDHPVLRADSGGGSSFHFRHNVFIWPLPPKGPLNVVVQWLKRDISETFTELDGAAIRAAALEAREIWPGLKRRGPDGLPVRRVLRKSADASDTWTAFGAAPEPETP
ncbi:hypothetical protein [Amycolatopsis sp.]|jgi:hypothetical protein|uniref:hypothetical protein n=1 Tax=Amycolatopsis sp. TaxID=37632 RepID=UPI002DF9F156|nr:hypothetical protein [Amycolatopsis sp.]